MPARGIVEGFYGRPYTVGQRKTLMGLLTGLDGASWLYAPKDDPWHRLRWRDSRPEESSRAIRQSMADAAGAGVAFFFGLSPWRFADSESRIARETLLGAVADGASGVVLLFDDVDDDPSAMLAGRQADFALGSLEGIGTSVMICPSVYCGEQLTQPGAHEYLAALSSSMPEGWGMLWTGPEIVSRHLDAAAVRMAEDALCRKPVIWDNLLADDYAIRRIYLAPLYGRAPSDASYFLNPSARFPVAAHAAMSLVRSTGIDLAWPESILGRELPGWKILASLHHTPWDVGMEGRRLLSLLSTSLRLSHPEDTVSLLYKESGDLADLIEALPDIEGGFDLLPFVTDARRMIHVWIRALRAPAQERMATLRFHLLERLPYEHPLADLTRECAEGRGS
jgi:hypothetical protein